MSDSDLMRCQENAIYFEVDKGTADDVSKSLRAGADAVDRLQRAEELLRRSRESLLIFEEVLDDHFPETVAIAIHRKRRQKIDEYFGEQP